GRPGSHQPIEFPEPSPFVRVRLDDVMAVLAAVAACSRAGVDYTPPSVAPAFLLGRPPPGRPDAARPGDRRHAADQPRPPRRLPPGADQRGRLPARLAGGSLCCPCFTHEAVGAVDERAVKADRLVHERIQITAAKMLRPLPRHRGVTSATASGNGR